MTTEATVRSNPDEQRYEIHTAAGHLAGHSEYVDRGEVREFRHTEVDDAYEGQGLGGELVRGALDHARFEGWSVRARCPFVKAWLEDHPEYHDLLA